MILTPAQFRAALQVDTADGPRPFGSLLDEWQRRDFEALDAVCAYLTGSTTERPLLNLWLQRSRGHSKTSDVARAVAHLLLCSHARPERVIWAAGDEDQAGLCLDVVRRDVALNPHLRPLLDIQSKKVIARETGSELTVITSDAPTSMGLLPSLVVADELVCWGNRELFDSLASAVAKTSRAALIVTTNAGTIPSWQFDIHELARTSSAWYFSSQPGVVASWLDRDKLAEQERILLPGVFRRYWKNLWQSGGDFLSREAVEACVDDSFPLAQRPAHSPGQPSQFSAFIAGVDASVRRDASAVVVVGVDRQAKLLRVVYCQTWMPQKGKDIDLKAIEDSLYDLHQRFRFSSVRFDPYQMVAIAQNLNRRGVPMVEVPFTSANCNEMATALLEATRGARLKMFRDQALIDSLLRLSIVERPGAGLKIQAPRTAAGHCDQAIALSLCLPRAMSELSYSTSGSWGGAITARPKNQWNLPGTSRFSPIGGW